MTAAVGGTVAIHEYSGVSIYNPLDKIASSTGTSAVPNSTSVTTTLDNELYFGLAWSQTDGELMGSATIYTNFVI